MQKNKFLLLALTLTLGYHVFGKVTVIPLGTFAKGTLRGRNIEIDGDFEGRIIAEETAVITQNAKITGSVETVDATIEGIVTGNIRAVNSVILTSTAEVDGSIQTMYLTMEEGSIFNGTSTMELKRKGVRRVEEEKKPVTVAPTPTRRVRRRRR